MTPPKNLDNTATPATPATDPWRDYVAERFLAQQERMDSFEKKLDAAAATAAETTASALQAAKAAAATAERVELATADVVSTLASWNGAMQIIQSTGKFLKPITYIIGFCTAVVGLWVAIKHGFYKED